MNVTAKPLALVDIKEIKQAMFSAVPFNIVLKKWTAIKDKADMRHTAGGTMQPAKMK